METTLKTNEKPDGSQCGSLVVSMWFPHGVGTTQRVFRNTYVVSRGFNVVSRGSNDDDDGDDADEMMMMMMMMMVMMMMVITIMHL